MSLNKSALMLSCLLSLAAWAAPSGFEDPVLLGKVMKGDIVVENVLDTGVEFRTFVRAFFNKVSPDAYTDLATSHKEWVGLVPDIKDAKTTKVNPERTIFEYWLHLKVKYGLFSFDIYPEGRQTITRAPDAISEWLIQNVVTNYQDQLKQGEETQRLIPYKGGMLVEDNIHVVLHKANSQSQMVKKELEKKFISIVENFRKKLGGHY